MKVGGAAASATIAAGLLYLNHRYGLSTDVNTIRHNRADRNAVIRRISRLGDNVSIYRMLELCEPDVEALWFEGRTWTYAQLKNDVDRFASILERRDVSVGKVVAVFATNSPEMVIAFIALTRLGAVPAMINNSLRSQTLCHCLDIANAELIVCTPDLASVLLDLFHEASRVVPCLSLNLSSFPPLNIPESISQHTPHISQIRYEDLVTVQPSTSPLPKRTVSDPGALIYTSGTSGHPKAVNIKNFLLVVVSTPLSHDTRNRSRYFPLRTYSCLPLYHGTGLFVGLCYSIGNSSTFCLGRRFSARTFSRELCESRATRMVYVGELCRYLLRAPSSLDHDKKHNVIVATGNGMARDVWTRFQDRFNIPEVRELYRSTEGIAKFNNFVRRGRRNNGAGKVGFQGPLMNWYETETYLVRYDTTTEKPWRDPTTGFCRVVGPNEPGEAIGRVVDMATYNEYLNNKRANDEKLMSGVFAEGDLFQRTGDLLVRDSHGWISFLDRTGDTYRWHGENVSAGEVREHVARLDGVVDCVAFAVKLAAYDGQAGAVALVLENDNDDDGPPPPRGEEDKIMAGLYANLRKGGLASWQLPRLVRVVRRIDTGSTFKYAKEVVKKKTWDPDAAVVDQPDRLYWLDGERYVRLDARSWKDIQAGTARL